MNVTEAVRTEKEYIAEIYSEEPAKHIGVAEVVFDELGNTSKVTVGFFSAMGRETQTVGDTRRSG